jgi:hypothetical protein
VAITSGAVPTVGLRFEIDGDASKFEVALKKAEKIISDVAKVFADSTIAAVEVIGKSLGEGSGGWEDAVTGAFDGAQKAVSTFVSGTLALLPGWYGKIAAGIYEAFKTPIDNALDESKVKLAEWSLQVVQAQQQAMEARGETSNAQTYWGPGLSGKFEDVTAGLEKTIAGAGFLKAKEAIEQRTAAWQHEAELIGKTAEQAAQLRAEFDILGAAGKNTMEELSAAQQHVLGNTIKESVAAAADRAARQKANDDAKEYSHFLTSINSNLERQIAFNKANADAITKTAGERAKERAAAQIRGYGRKGEGERALADPKVQAGIANLGDEAQAAAGIKLNNDLAESIRQQSQAYELQIKTLGASAGETERLKFLQMELNQAYRAGVPVTESLRASMESAAKAMGMSAQQAADAQQRMKDLQSVGQSMSRSLEDAFVNWTTKGKFSAKEMLQSIAVDIERLALRALILQPLFGGGSTPGAGLFGSLFKGLGFGGFKAGGGDVSSSSAYVVGEKGPELFVPRSAGTIVPNGGGSQGPQVIQMSIDLKGANGDETIARIAGQAARTAAMTAIQQSNAGFPARQRQFQMLGT